MTLQPQHHQHSCALPTVLPHFDVSVRFGRRVRALRRRSGRTQLELALHLGIDRSFLSDVERGKKGITPTYLETIAQGFGMSLSEMMADL
jgi:transcriptional regulator with XRE-family HTH domain